MFKRDHISKNKFNNCITNTQKLTFSSTFNCFSFVIYCGNEIPDYSNDLEKECKLRVIVNKEMKTTPAA